MPSTPAPNRIREVFVAAIRQPSASWNAYLDECCGTDVDLRCGVRELLDAHLAAGSFLEHPALDPAGTMPYELAHSETAIADLMPEPLGATLGPYRLVSLIGEGGMGSVYRAEQSAPVRRTVALKLVRTGVRSRHLMARFEAEKQALAMMDHPNIASVLDAGTTTAGRSYFVMELVEGVPITRYCDEKRLTIRERLELFIPICRAIQHAHQKGVIHRDLKPSNVLVAEVDGQPVPKVIDFGVAKALGQPLTDTTLITGFGAVIGTPESMSPEQAGLNNRDVDTRSDIFSLGALLYELIAGSTPLTRARLKHLSLVEVLRLVREEDPPRPSVRLNESRTLLELAWTRGVESRRLIGQVRGELDWIVMKALEKDRSRRYETANALAADISAHLQDGSVAACPPSPLYRLKKFARRNKLWFVTGAAAALVLVAAFVGLSLSHLRITREKAEKEAALADAEANLTLARRAVDEMYMEIADQLNVLPYMQPYQRDVMERALKFYQEFSQRRSSDPRVRTETAHTWLRVMRIRWLLAQRDGCEEGTREVIQTLERLDQELPTDVARRESLAEAYSFLGGILRNSGRKLDGDLSAQRALAIYHDLLQEQPGNRRFRRQLAQVYNSRASGLILDQPQLGEECHREAIRHCQILLASQPDDLLSLGELTNSYYLLGYLLAHSSSQLAGESEYRRAIELYETRKADLDRTGYRGNYAGVLHQLGRFLVANHRHDEAEHIVRNALLVSERLDTLYPDIPYYREVRIATSLNLLALLTRNGRTEEAATLNRTALELAESLMGMMREASKDPRQREQALNIIGALMITMREAGALTAAERYAHEQLKLLRAMPAEAQSEPGAQHRLASVHGVLGIILMRAHRYPESAAAHREALTHYERLALAYPDDRDFRSMRVSQINTLGTVLRRIPGQTDEAVRLHRLAIDQCRQLLAESPDSMRDRLQLARAYYSLGLAQWRTGRWDEVIAALEEALDVSVVATDPDSLRQVASINNDLAWIMSTCADARFRDSPRALDHAQMAVDLDPRPSYWNTLGVAWYRLGYYSESLVAFENSMKAARGGDSFDWFFVGLCYWHLGQPDTARCWQARAVQWMEARKPKDDELIRFRTEAEHLIEPVKANSQSN